MPELPEVETIARGLAPLLVGQRFTALTVLDRRVFVGDATKFRAQILGRAITGVTRRGKLCLVEIDGGGHVAFHLKMTGRLFVARPDPDPAPHLRVLLTLDSGRALHFHDMRRFGSCRGFAPGGLETWDFYAGLGPEPLELSDAAFDAALGSRAARIKALLLDQHVLAGVGNIYADEALFAAGIRPMALARDISRTKRTALLAALKDILCRAINAGGSTIRDYRTAEGVEGSFQWDFAVYGRGGKACTACKGMLLTDKVAGRTTTYCPQCQK